MPSSSSSSSSSSFSSCSSSCSSFSSSSSSSSSSFSSCCSSSSSSFSWSSCASLSSSSYSSALRFVESTEEYRALTTYFDTSSEIAIIFIITDFENLYREPLASGEFKCVSRVLLERNWIDADNLVFWWRVQTYNDDVREEAPVVGSNKICVGDLEDIVTQLQGYVT